MGNTPAIFIPTPLYGRPKPSLVLWYLADDTKSKLSPAGEDEEHVPGLRLLQLSVKSVNPLMFVDEFMVLFLDQMRQGYICQERTIKML